jgi:hypothetical protein
MIRRKYYYRVFFCPEGQEDLALENDNGVAYAVAVSKGAAARQVKQAAGRYPYRLNTLTRITKREYDQAHQ